MRGKARQSQPLRFDRILTNAQDVVSCAVFTALHRSMTRLTTVIFPLLLVGCGTTQPATPPLAAPSALPGETPSETTATCPVPAVTQYPTNPNQRLYLAIRFNYPQMLHEALAQGADINAQVPAMERISGCDQYHYRPVSGATALPMFVHAFNYGNIDALQFLAGQGATFAYTKAVPAALQIPNAVNSGQERPYGGLHCHYKRRNLLNEDGRMTGQFAGCYDLYRTLADGGYRFDRYDLAQMLTSGGWESFGKYRYMREHADVDEIAAFDRQEADLARAAQQAWEKEQQSEQLARQFQRRRLAEQRRTDQQERNIKAWVELLSSNPPVGQQICSPGQLHYPTEHAPTGYQQQGILRATLKQVSADGRQISFRIVGMATDSGALDYPPTGQIMFDHIPVIEGAIYQGHSQKWFPCQ